MVTNLKSTIIITVAQNDANSQQFLEMLIDVFNSLHNSSISLFLRDQLIISKHK